MSKYKQTLFRITKRIVVSFMVFMCLLQTLSYGATQEEAGQALAQFCINFYNEHGSQTIWDPDNRDITYQNGTYDETNYRFDCVGWVSYAIHWGLGLGDPTFTYFAVPPGRNNYPSFYNGFECIEGSITDNTHTIENIQSTIQPGDILFQHRDDGGAHVLIYVGEVDGVPSVIHSATTPLSKDPLNRFTYCTVGRITSETAANAKPAVAGVVGSGNSWDEEEEDEEFEVDENFYGLPLEGHYGGRTTLGGWIFDVLTQFIDYLAGVIFTVIKIEPIGWTRIFENGISNIIHTITQTKTTSEVDNTSSTNNLVDENKSSTDNDVQIGKINDTDENDVITIEDIIYNRVPILDANVFNFAQAGGMDLAPESVVYKLRGTIATWYEIFRRVAIVVMLGMLIYLGIRMSLSSIAEKKASYKKALTSWLVGFTLIFFIHYIMILVLNLNSNFVDLFNDIIANATEDVSTEGTIYDTMLTRAYSLPLSISLPGTVMYLVLVYYMIKFLFIYVKRYVVLNILTLMAPVMVLKYTFESAGTGKKSNAISSWLSDYVFNVLIQLIHAMLYCSFMLIALKMSSESVAGFVIALVIMHFISKADKTLMKIFNFGRGKSVEDTSKQESIDDVISGVAVAKTLAQNTKGAAKFIVGIPIKTGKAAGNLALDIADIWSEKDSREFFSDKYHKAELGVQSFFTEKVLRGSSDTFNNLLEAKRALYSEGGSGEDERIKKTLEARKKLKKKMRKDAFRYGTAAISNAGMMIASIPMMVAAPKLGFSYARGALQNMRASSKVIDGYIPTKHKFYPNNKTARALINAATFGMAGSTVNTFENAKKNKNKIENELPADASTLAKTAAVEKDIDSLYKELTEDKKGRTEKEEKFAENDKFFEDVTKDQIDLAELRNEVDKYMYANEIDKVKLEDISAVIKNIETLYGKPIDENYRTRLENTIRTEFNKKIADGNKSLGADEAVDAIKEGVVKTHSIDTSQLDDTQQQIVSKIEELNRLEMESTQRKGKQLIDANEIVSNIQKKNRKN